MKKRILLILFLLLLIGAGAAVYLGQRRVREQEPYYSGTIEATRAELAFQTSGRVRRVLVDEGEDVTEGRLLAELDRSELEARRDMAEARLVTAEREIARLAALLEVHRATLPDEVDRAQAGVEALKARVRELEKGYRPQDVEQARLALASARETLDKARKNRDRYERLYREGSVSEEERDRVVLQYENALRAWERAREQHALLREGFRAEEIETARARLAEGRAVLALARGNLQRIQVTEREIETARARVDEARAALALAEVQLGYTRLFAPFDGTITVRSVEPGEVVIPSREVLSLTDLSRVDLVIFVNETEIGMVKPGQDVDVKVDTFPVKVYPGKVTFISSEAEFTPKFIQTQKERVKLVYLVEVSIPNPERELKPGMPADAWLR
ncbi:MAG: efflux RND transporter periplasmic adaptor subunit [Deltaproteobacteria bacterium]|nr:efflux RND transporter periplasmic adaptor subunit [Deltaproteobacteria bacterium]